GDVEVMLALARVRVAAGNPVGALDLLAVARERAPQRADLLKLQGDIAAGLGDLERAREAFEAALALDPRFVQVWVDLGRVHETRKDSPGAERCYRAALDVLPSHKEAVIALAGLHRREGSPRAAVNLLVDFLTGSPSDVEAMVALGHG